MILVCINSTEVLKQFATENYKQTFDTHKDF